jgi:hypothetical protein
MRITSHKLSLILALAGGLCLSGCTAEAWQNWDWFGMKKDQGKPVTKARNSPNPEPVAERDETPVENPKDDRSREVDERVERYVKSMNASYDPSYESNDFNSKMRRQSDPNRMNRIQRTAERSQSSDQQDREAMPIETLDRPAPAPTPVPATERQSSEAPTPRVATADHNSTDDSASAEPTQAPDKPRLEQHKPASPILNQPSVKTGQETSKPLPPRINDKSSPVEKPREPSTPIEELDQKAADPIQSDPKPITAPPAATHGRPPVLGEVKVEAAKTTEAQKPATLIPIKEEPVETPIEKTPEKPAPATHIKETRPAANTAPQESTDAVKQRLTEQEARVARQPDNVEEQFRLRMMYLADGQDDKALAPAEGMNEEVQEIMQAQIKALMSARSSAKRDPSSWANRQMESIEALRNLVRTRADLRVPRIVLCTAIESFGRYEPIDPCEFKAGEKNRVLVYIEVENFKSEQTAEGKFRTLLSIRQSLLTKSGEEKWSAKDDNIEDLSRQRRNDFYLTVGPLAIPKTLEPGDYAFKIEVEDMLGQKLNSGVVKFKMVP